MNYIQACNIVNINNALERLDNDMSLYAELVDVFLLSPPFDFLQIQSFIAHKQLTEVTKEIHKLKGIAASLGADDLYNSCYATECCLKGLSMGTVESHLGSLEILYNESIEAFFLIREKIA